MKKTMMTASIVMLLGTGSVSASNVWSGNFQMYAPDGLPMYYSSGPVVGGQTLTTIDTTPIFLGETFVFRNLQTYTSTFSLDNGSYTNVAVGTGQIGASMLFDWGTTDTSTSCGKTQCNIDVIQVWDVISHTNETHYLSTDIDGSGWPGAAMLNSSPYPGFTPSFNMVAAVPVPAATWLFGSGLLGIAGMSRRKKIR